MRKFPYIIILIGFCFAKESLVSSNTNKNDLSQRLKKDFVQVGHIDKFVLDQGYPFKKQSVFDYMIFQQGKLKEFILDHGYPSRMKPGQTLSNFKIIGEY